MGDQLQLPENWDDLTGREKSEWYANNYNGPIWAYSHDDSAGQGEYWAGGNTFFDWLTGQDTFAHNEAVLERNFNATEAQKTRDWEKMMSDTAYQRGAADLEAAGLSKLALIGGAGASTPSTSPAHQNNSPKNAGNNFGNFLGSMAKVLAMVFTHGASTATETFSKASSAIANAEATQQISAGARKAIETMRDTGDFGPLIAMWRDKSDKSDYSGLLSKSEYLNLQKLMFIEDQQKKQEEWWKDYKAKHPEYKDD